MPFPQLDRNALRVRPLAERENKLSVERDCIQSFAAPAALSAEIRDAIARTAAAIREARDAKRPVILAFGAHTIKNGLGPVLIRLMEEGWLGHLATNGAGIIHDWEFAFLGQTSEDVRANTAKGQFGIWEETGRHLNLAIAIGAYDGLGYGESAGRLIIEDGHRLPAEEELLETICDAWKSAEHAERAAGAADLLGVMKRFGLRPGFEEVPHCWKDVSVQAAAYRLGIPFTAHPMIGHDIIYTHPFNHVAAIGRAAQRDFLSYAHAVSRLSGGVYLSVGSAIMSPMIFEKSMSMGQNLALQHGARIEGHRIVVVDLAPSRWDWNRGEPPADSPEYYLRYCKTFSRMGGDLRYVTCDNRDFLLGLYSELSSR